MKGIWIQFMIVIILIVSTDVAACSCSNRYSMKDYQYIAYVEILGVSKLDFGSMHEVVDDIDYQIFVRTLMQYKGQPQESLIVYGGNSTYELGASSCEMGIIIGEKWVIYGKTRDKDIYTGYCTPSLRHKNIWDEVDFKYARSVKRLESLTKKFSKPLPEHFFQNYKNGKVRIRQSISHGTLEGEQIIYYSNGQVMIREQYSCGVKNGEVQWYYRNGDPHKLSSFVDGVEVCERYYYLEGLKTPRISFYDEEGNFQSSQDFSKRH